jgi:hypothetical protein
MPACQLDPDLRDVLQDIDNESFNLTFFPLAVMLPPLPLVAIRSAALPGSLGWAAAALSLALAVGGDLASEWPGLPTSDD